MAKADDDDDDDDDDGYRVAQLSVAVSLENSHTEQVSGKVIFELSFEEEEEEKEEEDDEEDGDDVNRNGRISCFKSMVCVELVREEAFRIPAGGALTHVFSPMLHHNPRLWWPNGLGPHPLYNVRISVHVDDSNNINNNNNNNNNNKDKATHFSSLSFSSQSDEWTGRFGFREIKTHVDTATGGRVFVVNGQRVFIRGGNWTVSDGMLRLSRARYAAEVRLHASANLNMIRVWGGALTERPDFYDACDENGILVWQEFWITGDCNGRGLPPSDRAWPLDHALFLRSATDAVRMLRNHASLAIWVGGNECTPPPDIIDRLQTLLARPPPGQHPHTPLFLDGTRDYVQGSLWDGFAKGNGDFSDGPYGIQEPRALFAPDFYPYAFNPEVGSVGVPDADTIRATMPPEAWAPPVLQKRPDGLLEEVWNKMWEYHKYIPYTQPGKVRSQVALYGEPRDLDSFCEQAQLANFVQYRALVESWNSRMWRSATGMLIWKTQNPWPGLRGQLYDCHLADTGGLYGVQRAAEPVHIQLNLATRDIEVINSTRHSLSSHMVRAIVVDLDGLPLCPDLHWSGLDLEPNSATTIGHLPDPTQDGHHHDPARQPLDLLLSPPPPPALSSAYFVVLYLRDAASGAQVSRNLYWLHGPGGDYVAMGGRWREQAVPVQVVVLSCTVKGGVCRASVTVENRGGGGRDTETEAGSRSADFVESHESLMGDMMQKCCSLCTRNSGGGVSAGEGTDESKCSSSGCLGCCGSRGPVAFWVRLRAEYEGQPKKMDTKEGDEQVDDVRVLPAYFSNNYVSLLHGEKCVVNIEFEIKGDGGPVVLIVRGWNVPEQRLPLRPQ